LLTVQAKSCLLLLYRATRRRK